MLDDETMRSVEDVDDRLGRLGGDGYRDLANIDKDEEFSRLRENEVVALPTAK